jgi:hypothetical protein
VAQAVEEQYGGFTPLAAPVRWSRTRALHITDRCDSAGALISVTRVRGYWVSFK